MKECIFVVDLGTSGPKAALVSLDSEVLGWELTETPLILTPDGGVEQDAEDWWQKTCEASKALLSRKDIGDYKIIAVAITSQWSTVVAVDEDGRPIGNAISWMDARGAGPVRRMMQGMVNIDGYGLGKLLQWLRLTNGMPGLSGKDTVAHILYIKEKLPEVYEKTYKFLEAKDYLNTRLTGKFVTTPDTVTLYWLTDNRKSPDVTYNSYLLKQSSIDRSKLPDIVSSTDVVGTITKESAAAMGLPEGLPVVAGAPDVHSAALGSGGIDDFDGHLYLGTSSWLTCHVPFRKVSPSSNMATIPSAIPGKNIIGNEQESAGFCLTHLGENLLFPEGEVDVPVRPAEIYEWLNQVASKAEEGSGRVIFTPWMFGERTPVENKTIRGGFHNVSGATRRADLCRSVFEGVAYNSRWLMEAVEKFNGRPFSFLRIAGGGAVSDLWCQIHADVLNREIRRVKEPRRVNVRGVALLAALTLGKVKLEDMSSHIAIDKVFLPRKEHRNIYDSLYREFLNLYKAQKKIFARLNG